MRGTAEGPSGSFSPLDLSPNNNASAKYYLSDIDGAAQPAAINPDTNREAEGEREREAALD